MEENYYLEAKRRRPEREEDLYVSPFHVQLHKTHKIECLLLLSLINTAPVQNFFMSNFYLSFFNLYLSLFHPIFREDKVL